MRSIIWSFGRLFPFPNSHWIEGDLKMVVEASVALNPIRERERGFDCQGNRLQGQTYVRIWKYFMSRRAVTEGTVGLED